MMMVMSERGRRTSLGWAGQRPVGGGVDRWSWASDCSELLWMGAL